MAGKVRTYNPKEVLISFGTHSVTGYAEDSFVNLEKNGDGISDVIGCDGEQIRSLDQIGRASCRERVYAPV